MKCNFCGSDIDIKSRIGRRDVCPKCGEDLRICLNCRFYDQNAHNQCREPVAEPVRDKDRSNFCDYFEPQTNGGSRSVIDEKKNAMEMARKLFKK